MVPKKLSQEMEERDLHKIHTLQELEDDKRFPAI